MPKFSKNVITQAMQSPGLAAASAIDAADVISVSNDIACFLRLSLILLVDSEFMKN